jgi:hypothetical protein
VGGRTGQRQARGLKFGSEGGGRFVWESEVRLEDVDRPELVCLTANAVGELVPRDIGGRCAVLCLDSVRRPWQGENGLTVVPEDTYGIIRRRGGRGGWIGLVGG